MPKSREEYLTQPFLDYKGVMAVLGDICKKDKAYELMKKLLSERDQSGELLIDPNCMPDIGKIIVPTDALCKRYKIKRTKRKDAS